MGKLFSDIGHLNDDCLRLIFMELPYIERIKIERVCKRWRVLSKDNCWTDLKSFDTKFIQTNILNMIEKRHLDMAFFHILFRCGFYLEKIDITFHDLPEFKTEFLFIDIYKYCSRLSKIIFRGALISGNTDHFYGKVFLENKNLNTVKISSSYITGSCLSNLSPKNLTHLEIRLERESDAFITKNFSSFKNLASLNLRCTSEQIDDILDSINCENLTDLTLHKTLNSKSNVQPNYKKHLKKFTNLKLLNLYHVKLKYYCLKDLVKIKLKCLNLNYFSIKDYEQFLVCIESLQNLESIKLKEGSLQSIDDNFFHSISKCKKMKLIELNRIQKITTQGLFILKYLPDLETLVVCKCRQIDALKVKKSLASIKNIEIKD